MTYWFIDRYVNGNGYFSDLADALEQAKEEIFITDWWSVCYHTHMYSTCHILSIAMFPSIYFNAHFVKSHKKHWMETPKCT